MPMTDSSELFRLIQRLRDEIDELKRQQRPLQLVPESVDLGTVQVVPVKLTAKTNDTTYTGDLYGNGMDQTATATGVTIRVYGVPTGKSLPTGVRFEAAKESWPTIGGSGRTDYWTLIGIPQILYAAWYSGYDAAKIQALTHSGSADAAWVTYKDCTGTDKTP